MNECCQGEFNRGYNAGRREEYQKWRKETLEEIGAKLRKVGGQYGAGGHTHRQKMLEALASEIEAGNFEALAIEAARPEVGTNDR